MTNLLFQPYIYLNGLFSTDTSSSWSYLLHLKRQDHWKSSKFAISIFKEAYKALCQTLIASLECIVTAVSSYLFKSVPADAVWCSSRTDRWQCKSDCVWFTVQVSNVAKFLLRLEELLCQEGLCIWIINLWRWNVVLWSERATSMMLIDRLCAEFIYMKLWLAKGPDCSRVFVADVRGQKSFDIRYIGQYYIYNINWMWL